MTEAPRERRRRPKPYERRALTLLAGCGRAGRSMAKAQCPPSLSPSMSRAERTSRSYAGAEATREAAMEAIARSWNANRDATWTHQPAASGAPL